MRRYPIKKRKEIKMSDNKDLTVNPLSGNFSTSGADTSMRGFAHPKEKAVLENAKEILGKTETGARLLDVMNHYKIPIRVMSGREITYTTPDDSTVYLMAPPAVTKSYDVVALTLGCGIRDVEQGMVGFKRPDKDLDPVEYAAMTFSKSLDIIVNMCKIADELKEKLGFQKPLDIVYELGHGNIYKAQKANADYNEIVDLFVEGERNATEGLL